MNEKTIKWLVGILAGLALVLVGELTDRPTLTAIGGPIIGAAGIGAWVQREQPKKLG